MSLFFILTGYLLSASCLTKSFHQWYWIKVIRLYIPLTIVNLITVACGFRSPTIQLFLFPISINLWYAPTIAILYIPYYFVVRYVPKYRVAIIGAVVIGYFMFYFSTMYDRTSFFVEPVLFFRVLYGFTAMLLGSLLRQKLKYGNDAKYTVRYGIIHLMVGVCCLLGFLSTKLLMNQYEMVMQMQFLTQAFSVAFAYCTLSGAYCFESILSNLTKHSIWKAIEWVSGCSLEIYLVQFMIIYKLKGIAFPLNLLFIIAVILVSAKLVHILSELLYKFIKSKTVPTVGA